MLHKLRLYCVYSFLLFLTACFGGGHYAPVIEGSGGASSQSNEHVVTTGETLYSIAWRYNISFKSLASTNVIGHPYIIYPGQKLRLRGAPKRPVTKAKSAVKTASNTPAKPQKSWAKSQSNKSAKVAVKELAALAEKGYPFRWQWPAKGKTVKGFNSSSAVHKGIDLQGRMGESVFAANSGKVVYAGSGLVGYGNLLILKHDDSYLSAYGHNRKLLVAEGDLVKVGEKIAEFGDSGTDKVKLHFQIRRNGQPINPLGLLPRDR
jgi:lipoprotein NlpD